jgi:hypothetical protein
MMKRALLAGSLSVVLAAGSLPANAAARPDATVRGNLSGSLLPIGEYITPLVTPGSSFQQLTTGLRADGTADANGGISTALSPDGKTLLVLTSGYNAGFFRPNGTAITTPFLYPLTGRPATCSTCTTDTFQWVFVYDVSGTSPVRKQAKRNRRSDWATGGEQGLIVRQATLCESLNGNVRGRPCSRRTAQVPRRSRGRQSTSFRAAVQSATIPSTEEAQT